MDRITQDIVKERLNDGNGGDAFLFWQLFERLDHIAKEVETVRDNLRCEIEDIKKNILPLQTEYQDKQGAKTTIKNFRITASGWIAFFLGIINLYLILKGF
jgi:hypothetical protein